jgi:hypothetical protein
MLVVMSILFLSCMANADIVQNFSVPGNNFMRIDENTLGEVPQNPAFDVTPTGFKWGGYAAGYRIEIDENERPSQSGTFFEELVFKGITTSPNITGSYAYTIFDSSGSNSPDSSVDLSGADAHINLNISDIWNGWFGGGDNGSGLPGIAGEIRATVLTALIRDANGDWYSSNVFCPSTVEDNSLDGTVATYDFMLNDASWYAVDNAVSTNLNALAGSDDMAMSYSATAGSPDLTAVTGGGIYVWNAFDTTNGQFAMTEIGWMVPEPATIIIFGLGGIMLRKFK